MLSSHKDLGVEVNCLLEMLLSSEAAIPLAHHVGAIVQHGGGSIIISGMGVKIGIRPNCPQEMEPEPLLKGVIEGQVEANT